MADKTAPATESTTAAVPNNPKKAAKAKKPRSKPSHPRTSDMVIAAIKTLKERGGSSFQAIKKYIAATYKIDAEKHSPFIKKYLKSAVASKELVQTKGKGASGSFKLSAAKAEGKPAKKVSVAKKRSPSKKPATVAAKKPAAKKPAAKKAAAKKPTVEKKKSVKALTTKKPKPVAAKKAPAKPKAAKKPKPAKKAAAAKAKKPAAKKASPVKKK